MSKDTALALFEYFETATYLFVNHNADTEEWIDENTPPNEQLPIYSVRLDAAIEHSTEEREYRLFVRTAHGLSPEDQREALASLAEQAAAYETRVSIENNGIELS